MVVTNVRGPARSITLAGTPVAGVLVWAPCSGDMRHDSQPLQLRRQADGGLPYRRRRRGRPQPLADAFRAELLSLARRSRDVAEVLR